MPESDEAGIRQPEIWPNYPFLPVKLKKRKTDAKTGLTIGILIDPAALGLLDRTEPRLPFHAEAPYSVFEINMFELTGNVGDIIQKLRSAPRRDYPSPEALCESWMVD